MAYQDPQEARQDQGRSRPQEHQPGGLGFGTHQKYRNLGFVAHLGQENREKRGAKNPQESAPVNLTGMLPEGGREGS